MIDKHVFLIGMAGCGKTTLGKEVSASLSLPFIDMDERIVQNVGCSISEFFARYGREKFRDTETNLLLQLENESPALISTGGGTVLRDINRQIMKRVGIIVLIDRPIEHIMQDIDLNTRPLLKDKGLAEVERLYNERINIYRDAATLTFENSKSLDDGIMEMENMIRNHFKMHED